MPVSNRKHLEALREADQRALAIKERADEKALELSRDAQHYRDEQANKLREQISEERGKYLTQEVYTERHEELIRRIGAVEKALAEGGGRDRGRLDSRTVLFTMLSLGVGFVGVIVAVLANAHVFG